MSVHIQPLPGWARLTKFKPQHPPVFETSNPTHDELRLALALLAALDSESRAWYGGEAFAERLRARLPK